MYFKSLIILVFVFCPNISSAFEVNSVELCMDKNFVHKVSIVDGNAKIDELKCKITIQKNQLININDFDQLYAIVSVSNLEKKAHERLEIHWVFLQDEKIREANTFKLSNTYYSKDFGLLTDNSEKQYIQLEKEYKDTYLGWIVSVVRLLVQPNQNFRTYSSKKFDKKLHIGKWKLTVIDKNIVNDQDKENLSREFMVYK